VLTCPLETEYINPDFRVGGCFECDEGPLAINHCEGCHSPDFGASLFCGQCEEGFELSEDRLRCVVANCDELLMVDDSVCSECEEGFYLYRGKCLDTCPLGTRLNKNKCLDNCPQNDFSVTFFDKVTERCILCEDVIDGCISCSQDKDNLVTCDTCDYKLWPTFDQLECTPC